MVKDIKGKVNIRKDYEGQVNYVEYKVRGVVKEQGIQVEDKIYRLDGKVIWIDGIVKGLKKINKREVKDTGLYSLYKEKEKELNKLLVKRIQDNRGN